MCKCLKERTYKKVPIWFLRAIQFLIVLIFAYIGFKIGRSPLIFPYLGLINENDFILFWFFTINTLYWSVAFGWSAFLAAYAFQLHGGSKTITVTKKSEQHETTVEQEVYSEGYGKIGLPKSLQQFFLNFLGGIVGWVILGFLIFTQNPFSTWERLILLIIALLGITGYLPYVLIIKNWFPGKQS